MVLTALVASCSLAKASDVTISVVNTENVQRQELIEVDAKALTEKLGLGEGETFVVRNALKQEVDYQLTYDGKLLVDVAVRPNGQAILKVSSGKPKTPKVYVCGKLYPERVDDIAWENDRTAYRIYGPESQRRNHRSFGVDVWVKNTPDLVVEKRYIDELENEESVRQLKKQGKQSEALCLEQETSYHYDRGYGLDCYQVGPTLGGGAPALLDDNGGLIFPYAFSDYEILDNGPLRFTVKVSYHPATINGQEGVVEHRIISLDKGSNFNKCEVWYDGLKQKTCLAAGVVLHDADLQTVELTDDYVAYADPTENPSKHNFQIFVAALFPNGVETTRRIMAAEPNNNYAGHAVGVTVLTAGEHYIYYFGSAWSKNDVRTFPEWNLRIEEFMKALHRPLIITVE